tara:strand:- start:15 stop:725 length:711 start_codon:yes stop_codon:yes gene_type:complete
LGYVGKEPAESALSSSDIVDGAILDADINASANIAMSKTAFSAGTGVTLSTNTLNVDAAQTGITSLLATDIKIGEDDQTKIDFEDANKINFYANNAKEVELAENSLSPGTSDGTALGTTSLMWSDLFLADGSVINFNNGDVTLTHSSSTLTIAGELSVTTLDIGGTNVTATAAELNLLDGDTSVGGSITLADSDGVVVNDGGTMKTIPASDVKTYASGSGTSAGQALAYSLIFGMQ